MIECWPVGWGLAGGQPGTARAGCRQRASRPAQLADSMVNTKLREFVAAGVSRPTCPRTKNAAALKRRQRGV